MKKKITVIHILGSGHCGSTLLDLLLSSHSQMVGVGEAWHIFRTQNQEKKLNSMICTCQKKGNECEFWRKVLQEFQKEWREETIPAFQSIKRNRLENFFFLLRKNYKDKNGEHLSLKEVISLNELLYKSISKISRKNIIVDSSKEAYTPYLLKDSDEIRNVSIHIIRDSRAVLWSYKKKYEQTLSPLLCWFSANLKITLLRKKLENNKNKEFIFVRYEDLAENPEKEMKKICKKIGIPYERKQLHFREHEHHQIGGNRMRLGKASEIKVDQSWKNNLNLKDSLLFVLLCSLLNLYYGYRFKKFQSKTNS